MALVDDLNLSIVVDPVNKVFCECSDRREKEVSIRTAKLVSTK